jgi:hypothetical protein
MVPLFGCAGCLCDHGLDLVGLAHGVEVTNGVLHGRLDLQNRLVCLPPYLAYPDTDHQVNDLVLDYYAEMAASGVM